MIGVAAGLISLRVSSAEETPSAIGAHWNLVGSGGNRF